MLDKTKKLLIEQEVEMSFDESVLAYLVDQGYNDEYGARPLRRLIQRDIENSISSKLISGEVGKGDSVDIGCEKGEIVIKINAKVKV